MALRTSGVELVVKGFSNFMSSMRAANKAIEKQGQAAQRASDQINSYGNKVSNAQRIAANAADRVVQAQNRLVNANERAARAAENSVGRQNRGLQALNTQMASLIARRERTTQSIITQSGREQSATEKLKAARADLKDFEGKLADYYQKNASKIEAGNLRVYNTWNKIYDQRDRMLKKVTQLETAEVNATKRVASAKENLAKIETKMSENTQKAHAKVATFADKQAQASLEYARMTENAELDVAKAIRNHEAALQNLKLTQDQLNMAMGGGAGAGGGAGVGGLIGGGAVGGLSASIAPVLAVLGILAAGIGIAIAGFKVLLGIMSSVASFIKTTLVGAFNILLSVANKVFGPIINFFKNIVTSIIGSVTGKLRELVSDFGESLAEFQRLQIMFVGLQARDISQATGMSMAEAFKYAGQSAKDLFTWIKKLAVTTPFTAKGISETLAMANAMGLTTEQSKQLTKAVGNFTAGMGLTEEHMYRIIYNFGQMFAQGKVTGREFRDLAISFVPVWRMLDNMAAGTGKTTKEFQKLAFSGGVPVLDFFNEFISMANSDFPGAMEKMAKTWTGVIGNAKDFLQVILGVNILGPSFNKITSAMADSLQKLVIYLTPISEAIGYNLSRALEVAKQGFLAITSVFDGFRQKLARPAEVNIGAFVMAMKQLDDGTAVMAKTANVSDTLKQKVDDLNKLRPTGFVSFIAKVAVFFRELGYAIAGILKTIGEKVINTMSGTAATAGQWGWNIVASIAYGMAKAVSLIVQVIAYIAGVIRYWLQAMSPPKALPELPKWGMEAMAEYLRGFTMADFDALKGIQGPLKDAFSLLVDTGKLGQAAAGKMYKDISVAIAKALSTGVVEESLFEKITRAAGPFGKEIAKLARLHIQLAQATRVLVAAEKALEEAQKREAAARVTVNSKVKEYNAMLRAGADKTSLAAKLAEVQASETAARVATEERKRQEDLVATLKEQVAALEEAVQLQEELVQQLIDITREQIIDLDTSGAQGAMGDLQDAADEFVGTLGGVGGNLGKSIEDAIAAINWDQAMADANTWIEDFKKNLGTSFDPLTKKGGPLDDLKAAFADLQAAFKPQRDTSGYLMGGSQKTQSRLGGLGDELIDLKSKIEDIITSLGTLIETFNGLKGDPLTAVNDLIDVMGHLADATNFLVGGLTYGVLYYWAQWVGMQTAWDWFATAVGNAALAILEFFQTTIPGAMEDLKKSARNAWDEFVETWAGIGSVFQPLIDTVKEWFGGGEGGGGGGGGKIMMIFTGFQASIATWFAGVIASAAQWGIDFGATVQEKIQITINDFLGWIEYWKYRLIIKWISFVSDARTHWDNFKNAIKEKIEKARDIVGSAIAAIQRFIDGITTGAFMTKINSILAKLGELYEKARAALAAIGIHIPALPVGGTGDQGDPGHAPGHGTGQFGTSVNRLSPTVVGEHGWEVYVPYAKGMILNQRQISDLIRISASQAYGGTMPYLHKLVASPTQTAPMVASSKQVNINFGGIVISNGMDMATFEARVRNVVREEFA